MAFHVDDYKIRWTNFRAFRDTGWITIRPLTILLGANDAGKTSVFSPLLLLAQTMRSPDSVTPIIAKGPLADLGSFQELLRNKDVSKPMSLGFKFHLHHESGKPDPLGREPPGVIEMTFGAGDEPEEPILRKVEISDAFSRLMYTRVRRGTKGYSLSSPYLGKMRSTERELIESEQPYNFLFTPTTAIRRARQKGKEFVPASYSEPFSRYLSATGFAVNELIGIFSNLAYVGPLRERPRRHYEVSGAIPMSVGVRGEDMANMVRRHFKRIRSSLNVWVRKFNFGSSVSIANDRSGEFALYFNRNGRKTNIADAGFGVSQVLPLIVQAIVAPKNTLTIAEQPEIHLNPKLQSTLADLFVEMAKTDHRVIVETHSEHLLLRLRRLIAKGAIEHSKVAVYFVEQRDGESKIREIKLGDNGSIEREEWPVGFFDDSLKESLALAQEQFSAAKKKKSVVKNG